VTDTYQQEIDHLREQLATMTEIAYTRRAMVEHIVKKWDAYFLPDVGPVGDEDKAMLFNAWTDLVAELSHWLNGGDVPKTQTSERREGATNGA
jgi:hypothetical protein